MTVSRIGKESGILFMYKDSQHTCRSWSRGKTLNQVPKIHIRWSVLIRGFVETTKEKRGLDSERRRCWKPKEEDFSVFFLNGYKKDKSSNRKAK